MEPASIRWSKLAATARQLTGPAQRPTRNQCTEIESVQTQLAQLVEEMNPEEAKKVQDEHNELLNIFAKFTQRLASPADLSIASDISQPADMWCEYKKEAAAIRDLFKTAEDEDDFQFAVDEFKIWCQEVSSVVEEQHQSAKERTTRMIEALSLIHI